MFQDPVFFPDTKEQPFISVPHANKSFTAEEIREMNEAVVCLKGLEEEKETLREIKEDREEYIEVSVILSSYSFNHLYSLLQQSSFLSLFLFLSPFYLL